MAVGGNFWFERNLSGVEEKIIYRKLGVNIGVKMQERELNHVEKQELINNNLKIK